MNDQTDDALFQPTEQLRYEQRPPAPHWARSLLFPLLAVAAGVLALVLLAGVEARWLGQQPWRHALLAPDFKFQAEGVVDAWVRTLPAENVPEDAERLRVMKTASEETKAIVDGFASFAAESIVALDLPAQDFAPLVAEGRTPVAGQPEVLAGCMARLDSFELDGHRFEVVGRLHRGVSAFPFAYLLPRDLSHAALFSESAGATLGSLHPEGLTQLETLRDDLDGEKVPRLMGGMMPALPGVGWSVLFALALVAAGGAMAQARLLLAWTACVPKVFRPLLEEMRLRPKLLIGMHALLLGTFFAAMYQGMRMPLWNARMMSYIETVFSEGELGYIGDAFAGGNPIEFAAAIFLNNYVFQTLGLTFGISIVPLALGVLKTLGSFGMVGFGMAPLWTAPRAGSRTTASP